MTACTRCGAYSNEACVEMTDDLEIIPIGTKHEETK